jgi:hypothetical protein
MLFVRGAYVSYHKKSFLKNPVSSLPFITVIDILELLHPLHQVLKFIVIDLDLSFNSIQFLQQLFDPHVHDIHDELLEKIARPKITRIYASYAMISPETSANHVDQNPSRPKLYAKPGH